jgi:hypothetical protein
MIGYFRTEFAMSCLPYSLSESIATHGWSEAWRRAEKHLIAQEKEGKAEDFVVDTDALARRLCEEPVTVQHRTKGALTAALPAALALDVLSHHGDHHYMDALETITYRIKSAYRRGLRVEEDRRYPKEADQNMALPAMGALWLVTWAHQSDARFKDRRKHGGSHTNVKWPDDYFEDAVGITWLKRMPGRTRLMEEAMQAYPLLASNLGPKADYAFRDELHSVLSLVIGHWRHEIKRGDEAKEKPLYELAHRVLQSGCMTHHKSSAWVYDFIYGGFTEERTSSSRLTRAVDLLAFHSGDSKRIEELKKEILENLEKGGQLAAQDDCHAERMRRLAEKHPDMLIHIRTHEAQVAMKDAGSRPASTVRRARRRT